MHVGWPVYNILTIVCSNLRLMNMNCAESHGRVDDLEFMS